MIIGLKQNTVELADHDPMWEIYAAQTIKQLWRVFNSTAKDIQHIGSTAIKGIKAKPMIDIIVAVDDFTEVETLIPALESAGVHFRRKVNDTWYLFAIGDLINPDGILTHQIHVLKADSEHWHNVILFRDYMNNNISAAKEYEALKIKLAEENPHDPGREKYLAGKSDFIIRTYNDIEIWKKQQVNTK